MMWPAPPPPSMVSYLLFKRPFNKSHALPCYCVVSNQSNVYSLLGGHHRCFCRRSRCCQSGAESAGLLWQHAQRFPGLHGRHGYRHDVGQIRSRPRFHSNDDDLWLGWTDGISHSVGRGSGASLAADERHQRHFRFDCRRWSLRHGWRSFPSLDCSSVGRRSYAHLLGQHRRWLHHHPANVGYVQKTHGPSRIQLFVCPSCRHCDW